MKDEALKLLLIGTLPNPIDPVGGGAIMFQYVLDVLAGRDDVVTRVVDTSGGMDSRIANMRRLLRSIWHLILEIPRADVVSVHITTKRLPEFGPFVAVLSRLFRRPYSVRIFGGADYRDLSGLRRRSARWVLRGAGIVAVETKMLLRSAQADGVSHAVWFPNNRPVDETGGVEERTGGSCRHFVFMAQVKPSKGVLELIEAAERLEGDVVVDVYGPLMEGITEENFAGLRRVRYCGTIPFGEVMPTLARYGALVLPTYYEAEGYPGVILESFCAGTPVICTRWRALPEIVDEDCGMLVEPRSADSLYRAMKRLAEDPDLHARLSKGARAKRVFFDTRAWCERFIEGCVGMLEGRARSAD